MDHHILKKKKESAFCKVRHQPSFPTHLPELQQVWRRNWVVFSGETKSTLGEELQIILTRG